MPFLLFKEAKWKTRKLFCFGGAKHILQLPIFTLNTQVLLYIARASTSSTPETKQATSPPHIIACACALHLFLGLPSGLLPLSCRFPTSPSSGLWLSPPVRCRSPVATRSSWPSRACHAASVPSTGCRHQLCLPSRLTALLLLWWLGHLPGFSERLKALW